MNAKLLIDGKNAFPFILNKIENAKTSLLINMFIWRDDDIGNRMAKASLDFANRGGKVKIAVDRYAFIFRTLRRSKKINFSSSNNTF